ncbi:MAG: cupin domain-containing protein [Candidatus Eremiobacteraeota bacterium]|nr:cupin domain-containing protein [Candidatus Eremiobacteraeota bacterium]
MMTLQPGQESGEKGNEHAQSDQVLYVIAGDIEAEIEDEKTTLHAGDVVIVPAGAPHRFRNGGKSPAQTLNVYAPPAY